MPPSVDMRPPPGVVFRTLDPSNAQAANALFNSVFQQERPVEHYLWKFWGSPAGGPLGIVAMKSASREAIAVNTGIRKQVRIMGEDQVAMVLCESAADPNVRGGGRLYRQTTLGTGMHATEENLLLGYGGQSTDAAIKIGKRWFKYQVLMQLNTWEKRLSLTPALRAKFGSFGDVLAGAANKIVKPKCGQHSAGIEVEIVNDFGPEFDYIWMQHRDLYPVVSCRDAATLKWRYKLCPVFRHRVLIARKRGRAIGYLVWREWQRDGVNLATVMDLFHGKNTEVAGELLCCASEDAFAKGMDFIHFAVKPNSLEENVMRKLPGFSFSKRERPDRVLVGPIRTADLSEHRIELMQVFLNQQNWYYTQGDSDFLD